MKIFASSLPTRCQDCIDPVPVPLCAGQTALYYPSTALALARCLVVDPLFEGESQHHVFKTPCNSHGIVLAARESGCFSGLLGTALCTAGCVRYSKKWEQSGGKTPRICFALAQSPSVRRNKRMLQKALGEHVSLEIQRNTTSSPLPLPLPLPLQCLADTPSVSTSDAEEGSSPGMAEEETEVKKK